MRFAWWSAEEFGLLGSEHYVAEASTAELGDIAVYLNFDMIASPNFGRFLYDGDDSDAEGAGPGPEGSAAVEAELAGYFAARDLPTRGHRLRRSLRLRALHRGRHPRRRHLHRC